MSVCNKSLSLTIDDLTPAGWWTMEVGGDTLFDATGNANLGRTAGTAFTATAGKVNLAATASGTGTTGYETVPVAAFGFTGADLNLFGWTRLDNLPATNIQNFITYYDGAANFVRLRLAGTGTFELSYNAGFAIVSGVIPIGSFFFWRMHYDAVNSKWGVAINNAAVVYEAGTTVIVPGPSEVNMSIARGFSPPYFGQSDELCLFTTALTTAQVDSIYNAGAGRTFP